MKRVFFILLSFILILFVVITLIKNDSKNKIEHGLEKEYSTAEKERIQNFWETYRLANKSRIAGQLKEAADGYKKALQFNDQHEDALYYLGNVLLDLGEYAEAEKCWNKLIQINPHSARAHFQLGNLYLNHIRKEVFNINMAEKHFREVLSINEEESGSIFCLGQIELIRGNLINARQLFGAVSGLNYQNLDATFFNSYIDWKTDSLDRAISRLTNAIRSIQNAKSETVGTGEGDTKLGKPLYSTDRLGRKSLFYKYTHDLKGLDPSTINSQFEIRYRNLDVYLNQLQKMVSS